MNEAGVATGTGPRRVSTDRVDPAPAKPNVKVIGKAVAILDAFLPGPGDITLAEICRRVMLDRSTVYRILQTLETHHMVTRTTGGYQLGIKLFQLGHLVEGRLHVRSAAQVPMLTLAEQFQTGTVLAVREGDEALCIERIERGPVIVVDFPVGGTLPLHVGAVPLILLAAMPDSDVERILARDLGRLNERTLVDPMVVRSRIAEIRKDGIAYSDGDITPAIGAIGAPVRDATGQVVAAVSAVDLRDRLYNARMREIEAAVRLTAVEIGRELGFVRAPE